MGDALQTLQLCFDLDDTLIPTTCHYHRPTWRCGLIISKALGIKSPYPVELLKLHYEVDSGMVKSLGLSADRFPLSWVRTYELIAEKAGVPVDRKVRDLLYRTAAQFRRGPFAPFPGIKRTLIELQRDGHGLHLITSGDKRLQGRKIKQCGLAPIFDTVNITGVDKKKVMARIAGDRPELAVMIGDSKKSDILPAIELGMTAVYVPSETWAFAHAEVDPRRHLTIASVRELPDLVRKIVQKAARGQARKASP